MVLALENDANPIDTLLLDLDMLKVSGLQVLAKVRAMKNFWYSSAASAEKPSVILSKAPVAVHISDQSSRFPKADSLAHFHRPLSNQPAKEDSIPCFQP